MARLSPRASGQAIRRRPMPPRRTPRAASGPSRPAAHICRRHCLRPASSAPPAPPARCRPGADPGIGRDCIAEPNEHRQREQHHRHRDAGERRATRAASPPMPATAPARRNRRRQQNRHAATSSRERAGGDREAGAEHRAARGRQNTPPGHRAAAESAPAAAAGQAVHRRAAPRDPAGSGSADRRRRKEIVVGQVHQDRLDVPGHRPWSGGGAAAFRQQEVLRYRQPDQRRAGASGLKAAGPSWILPHAAARSPRPSPARVAREPSCSTSARVMVAPVATAAAGAPRINGACVAAPSASGADAG